MCGVAIKSDKFAGLAGGGVADNVRRAGGHQPPEKLRETGAPVVKGLREAAALRTAYKILGQYRIILSADTASEARQLLSQKRR